jgi:hypothetical protein
MAFSWSCAVLVTDVGDGRAHLRGDWDPQPLTGVRPVSVLCGRLISPAPLVAPIGPRCTSCVAAIRAMNARAGAEVAGLRHYMQIATRAWRGCRAAVGDQR